MKVLLGFRTVALVVLASTLAAARVGAQYFTLSASNSPSDSLAIDTPLTYTITVTNLSFAAPTIVGITNTFPSSLQFVSVSNYSIFGWSVYSNSTSVIFLFSDLTIGIPVQVSLTVLPTAADSITNWITLGAPFAAITNVLSTNLVNQVTNVPNQANLAVSVTGPGGDVIVGDYITFKVAVTNFGPSSAPGVTVSNSLSDGVKFISISSSTSLPSPGSSNVVLGLGTLKSGAVTNVILRLEPTNAAPFTFTAVVSGTDTTDPHIANNAATNSILVGSYLSTNLVAVTNSGQQLNRQVTLMEQTILLTNTGTTNVASARIVVSGLTNILYNAIGTNDGNPFVVYATTLETNQSVNLLLQYAPNRTSFTFTNGQLSAYEIPAYDLTPPANPGTFISLWPTNITLASGNVMIQFRSLTNRDYRIVYCSNINFSNALLALPTVHSKANWVQWIDYGPPETITPRSNSPARYYKPYLIP
jgi:uncharacterized repeat protein (TIGR01451 family)